MYLCETCGLEFTSFQGKANHYRWKHLYAFKNDNTKIKASFAFSLANSKRFGNWIEEDVICSKLDCNNIVHIKYRENCKKDQNFCSRKCANSRIHTDNTKEQCSKSLKKAWDEGKFDNKNQSEHKNFSSKTERAIVNYFKTTYPEHEWTSGGNLKYKDLRITRDLYSNILKICFEYDGIWHFKDIHGQLAKKQQKDKALEEWCKENHYRLIRIDENDFKDFQQIEQLFFENNSPIVKIGKRY